MPAPITENPTSPEFAAPARQAAAHMVKARARHYARRPMALDVLHPGLSVAPPATLVAIAAHILERERRAPRRWLGFGGEVSLLNARAALLLGRALRRTATPQIIGRRATEGVAKR